MSDVISVNAVENDGYNYVEPANPFENMISQNNQEIDYGFCDFEKCEYDASNIVSINENGQDVFTFTTDNIPDITF